MAFPFHCKVAEIAEKTPTLSLLAKRKTFMANILIVDPNEASLDMLQEFCTEEMHLTCQTAHNGQEALQILSEHLPDLVLSEIEMPNLNGFELLQRICRSTSSVPVVLMANSTAAYTWVDALQHGANGFFTKPLSLMMLSVELSRLLQEKRKDEIKPQAK